MSGELTTIAGDAEHDLSSILTRMQSYGRPRLHFLPGWYCCVEIHTPTAGTNYTIASDFGHATPDAAAAQCWSRMRGSLAEPK